MKMRFDTEPDNVITVGIDDLGRVTIPETLRKKIRANLETVFQVTCIGNDIIFHKIETPKTETPKTEDIYKYIPDPRD